MFCELTRLICMNVFVEARDECFFQVCECYNVHFSDFV